MSTDNNDTQPMEVLAPSAIMAIERAQIDTQVATAHQYPRSLEQFKKRALSMATLDEDTADSCIYCRPVGKEQDDKGKWVEKYAEGPSIRLAEIVAASYGNIRVAARVVEQTERFVRCEGVAHDLESNYAGKSECIESTVMKNGNPYSERQRALTAKVCLSKAFRDACFKVVPRALCKPVFEAAKKVAAGQGKTLEERRKRVQAWIGRLKIADARVFAAMGVNGWSEITDDHLIKLTGLKTAIADGDETLDSAFPQIGAPEGNKPTPTGFQQATQGQNVTEKSAAVSKVETAIPAAASQTTSAAAGAPAPSQTSTAPSNVTPAPSGEQGQGDKSKAESKKRHSNATMVEQPPATAAAPTPTTPSATPAEDTKALAQQGLAPATEPAAPAPVVAPTEPDPKLADKPGDSDDVKELLFLARRDRVTLNQIMSWAKANKLSQPDQKDVRELANAKVSRMHRAWVGILPDVRKQAA